VTITVPSDPLALAFADLTERLAAEHPQHQVGLILRVVEAARVGTGCRLRPAAEVVTDVEQQARADLATLTR
jgi:hypothetical protein